MICIDDASLLSLFCFSLADFVIVDVTSFELPGSIGINQPLEERQIGKSTDQFSAFCISKWSK